MNTTKITVKNKVDRNGVSHLKREVGEKHNTRITGVLEEEKGINSEKYPQT